MSGSANAVDTQQRCALVADAVDDVSVLTVVGISLVIQVAMPRQHVIWTCSNAELEDSAS